MTVGVVKCDFRFKVVILIRKDPSPGNSRWMSNIEYSVVSLVAITRSDGKQ